MTTDRELLSAAIKASGKSVRAFARDVLTRDPRSVWRWLSLAKPSPMPRAVRERCEAIIATPNAVHSAVGDGP